MKTTLRDLYRSPLNVWVEDPLSHAVLTELWADTQINVLVTLGKPGVQHMVRANPEPRRHQVHGIVDRDFGICAPTSAASTIRPRDLRCPPTPTAI